MPTSYIVLHILISGHASVGRDRLSSISVRVQGAARAPQSLWSDQDWNQTTEGQVLDGTCDLVIIEYGAFENVTRACCMAFC
ncbi:uncharacterized protein LAESUDRAFT_729748 [Laetiporus sulphureus 93-53]|uniref:Uncharacterized protein n=1 Tax=Laetiporus sulphureus 93-53 TaxID=1314785 RepID=A0A165CGZ8_9APHY|nr:uncharacterized protein LAESUDRAFT_729748 [Laetiporus sulphureus 93-53]KZT02790.1 hypothetical protein LAESUDRAFT_729748 [Laetiporus sulphureus 93-53]